MAVTRRAMIAGLGCLATLGACSRSGFTGGADPTRPPDQASLVWRDGARDRASVDGTAARPDTRSELGADCPRLVIGNLLGLAQQDLEVSTAGGWQNVLSPSSVGLQVTRASAHSGCSSLEVTVTASMKFVQLYVMGPVDKYGSFDAKPGTAYVWTAGVQSLQPQRQAVAALDLFDASWKTEHLTSSEVSLSSTWAQPWLAFTTRAATRYVQLYIQIFEPSWATLPVGDRYRIDFGVFRPGREVPTPDCDCASGD